MTSQETLEEIQRELQSLDTMVRTVPRVAKRIRGYLGLEKGEPTEQMQKREDASPGIPAKREFVIGLGLMPRCTGIVCPRARIGVPVGLVCADDGLMPCTVDSVCMPQVRDELATLAKLRTNIGTAMGIMDTRIRELLNG